MLQNRGRFNQARTPEVEAFEKKWLTWVRKGCRRNKDGVPLGAEPVLTKKPVKEKRSGGEGSAA